MAGFAAMLPIALSFLSEFGKSGQGGQGGQGGPMGGMMSKIPGMGGGEGEEGGGPSGMIQGAQESALDSLSGTMNNASAREGGLFGGQKRKGPYG